MDPIFVGKVTAGTAAGAASTAGVSPVGSAAESAVPVGASAIAQLPLAAALEPLFRPAAAPVGAIAHGSVAAATSAPIVSGEASALASPLVGAVTSGVVASATEATGATSTSSPVAAGAETSGSVSAETLAAAFGSVNGCDVSGRVTEASVVVGAVTAGCACVAEETAVTGVGAGAVDALAPDVLADACVAGPLDELDTVAVVGADTFGLTATDVVPPLVVGGGTLTVVGALTFTCVDGTAGADDVVGAEGAVETDAAGADGACGTDGGAIWAATGATDTALLHASRVRGAHKRINN